MNKKILFLGVIAALMLLLTACSPQKLPGDSITAKVVAEKSQNIASQLSPASVLGNIGHKKEKEALGINAQIISSELLSNEKIKIFSSIKSISYFLYNEKLKVNFRHNSKEKIYITNLTKKSYMYV